MQEEVGRQIIAGDQDYIAGHDDSWHPAHSEGGQREVLLNNRYKINMTKSVWLGVVPALQCTNNKNNTEQTLHCVSLVEAVVILLLVNQS